MSGSDHSTTMTVTIADQSSQISQDLTVSIQDVNEKPSLTFQETNDPLRENEYGLRFEI